MITVIHIVTVPYLLGADCVDTANGWHLVDNRDAEGLVVKSSAVSTLSALCSMFRMLAGLHTVVCVQTHLVGRGERRWLVKSWVVCCAKIHQRVLMMTPPLPNPPCIPVTYLTRAGDLVCGWCRVSCCVVVSEARAASPSESHL